MSELEPRLAEFLSAARARLTPARAGIVDPGRRRVAGLRREELAMLAGVSVDYFTRLEQGRSRSASPEVLEALADALQLDEAERLHLHAIARPAPARRRRATRPQHVHPSTRSLLDVLDTVQRPAYVLGRRLDVLAQNRLATLLVADFDASPAADRNQARFVFLDPHARGLYADWDQVAAHTAAMLRLDAGRHPEDPMLGQLVGELSIHSPEFRRLWARNRVHECSTGTQRYHHPLVGDLTIHYHALAPRGDLDQTVTVYEADPDSGSAHALRLLAATKPTSKRMTSDTLPEVRTVDRTTTITQRSAGGAMSQMTRSRTPNELDDDVPPLPCQQVPRVPDDNVPEQPDEQLPALAAHDIPEPSEPTLPPGRAAAG